VYQALRFAEGRLRFVTHRFEQDHIPRSGARPPRPRPGGDTENYGDRDEKKTRLAMAVGRRDGIRPADVVGSIANEADIPGRDIGPIDIRETVTFVTVPERHAEHVLEKVRGARFRGRPVNLRVADSQETEETARPFRDTSRAPRGAKERDRRPPRHGAGGAARPFARPPKGKGPPKGKTPFKGKRPSS
jgi:DbpA RNA binding domain